MYPISIYICSILMVFLWPIQFTYAQDPPPYTLEKTEILYQELYGLPLRLGFYLQGASHLVAFTNLKKYQYPPPLTNTVLATNSLISWYLRIRVQEYSLSEGWISLALALSLTIPGSWLLYSALIFTRAEQRRYKGRIPAKRDIVRGKGLSIFLTMLSTGGAVIAYIYFWLEEVHNFPYYNIIWVFGLSQTNSTWVHAWMYAHGVLLIVNLPLLIWTFSTWCLSMITSELPRKWKDKLPWPKIVYEDAGVTEVRQNNRMFLKSYNLCLATGVIVCVYWALLIVSIELTIKGAGLPPLTSFEQPGQLIPLLAGSFSLMTAIGSVFRQASSSEISVSSPLGSNIQPQVSFLLDPQPRGISPNPDGSD